MPSTPSHNKQLLLLLISLLAFTAFSKKLLFIQQVFRHGARYPLRSYDTDYSLFASEEYKLGELTNEGKHMHYILGKALFQKYWKQLFEGTPYQNQYDSSLIYVHSTNLNRTLLSAESQIYGWLSNLKPSTIPKQQLQFALPPYPNIQSLTTDDSNDTNIDVPVYGVEGVTVEPVPVHTVRGLTPFPKYKYRANPYDEGDFLLKYQTLNCPNQDFWMKENIASNDFQVVRKNEKVRAFLKELGQVVGKEVKYELAYQYIDTYISELYMGKPHLALFDNPENKVTAEFINLSSLMSMFHTDTQKKVVNTRLLQVILAGIKDAIAKNPLSHRISLFSGHDTTILSLTSALGLVSLQCLIDHYMKGVQNNDTCLYKYPSYATNIIFEVWEEDDLSHIIKVVYNGEPRKIPFCGNAYECRLNEFEKFVAEMSVPDPNDSCGIREQFVKLYIVIGVLAFFIVVFIMVEMKRRFKDKIVKKMEEMKEKKEYMVNFEEKEHESNPGFH